MLKTPHGHHKSVFIGGRPISNLRFAVDIDLMGGSSVDLQETTNRLVDRATEHEMEESSEKSKIMISSIGVDMSISGKALGEVTALKYYQPYARMEPACHKSASGSLLQ